VQQEKFKVSENRTVAKDIFLMQLSGRVNGIFANGDFVNISVPGTFLRRPISVFDVGHEVFTIVYKVVGTGTRIMSERKEGDVLDVLTGLGNGYDIVKAGNKPLVVGGGYGTASVCGFAKTLALQGKSPDILIGLNSSADSFFASAVMPLEAFGAKVWIVTVDGSMGEKGLVTDYISAENKEGYSFMYACGPIPMLRAISDKTDMEGQFSLESRMGCGFGACMGCSIMTKSGAKRICKEGPVLGKEEIIWT
jgi:dihydroorotate dehydrogenase electron transfer subunit